MASVNGQPVDPAPQPGKLLRLSRRWKAGDQLELDLPMEIVFVQANPLVEECRGQLAVMRGPVVYCLESTDLPRRVSIDDVVIVPSGQWTSKWQPDLLGGVVTIEGDALILPHTEWNDRLYARYDPGRPAKPFRVRLIPYYAWSNRGQSEMTVWLPFQEKAR